MNILLVGGTFDNDGGRPSSLISKMKTYIENHFNLNPIVYNGGFVSALQNEIIQSVVNFDIVMWLANVANEEDKIRDVKAINPKTILITSKRNDSNKYTFAELITRALSIKANLTIEFSKQDNNFFNMMVFDPLGNVYYNGLSIDDMMSALMKRTLKLTKFTRISSVQSFEHLHTDVPNETVFFNFAHECADIFHNLIRPAKANERFLGNMSFRCQNGFPSFRGKDGLIYVSRRNVDKSDINAASFVPVWLDEQCRVRYLGDKKPSVDTPIQLNLYKIFPWANYMLHAHCYINIPEVAGFVACTTANPVPCGALEEVDEVVVSAEQVLTKDTPPRLLAVNLKGHGCLLIAQDVEVFAELERYKNNCFVARSMPELQF